MAYPADTYPEAVDLSITASNQLHTILNGDSTTEVVIEDGSKIPSVRKAYSDSLFFLSPQPWSVGEYETVYNQLRAFVEPTGITTWWFSKTATVSTPILMSTTPHEDPNWTLWNAINNSIYETQKRLAAEADLNMVGSFLLGTTVITADDVVFYETDGKYYAWGGVIPVGGYVVPSGSTPATIGGVGVGAWSDKTDLILRYILLTGSGADIGYKAYPESSQSNLHDRMKYMVNVVTDYGADNTGVNSATAAIQNAVNSGAKVVYCPSGKYKMTGMVTVPAGVLLIGEGWSGIQTQNPTYGTIFVCTFLPSVASDVFYTESSRCKFQDFEIFCDYQPLIGAGWSPITTPTGIHAYRAPYNNTGGAEDTVIWNVMIRAMTRGAYVEGADRGEFSLYGQTFGPLLQIDGSFDTAKVHVLHVWAFYSSDENVLSWCRANADIALVGRADNTQWGHIFGFGVRSGIYYVTSSRLEGGGSQSHKILNLCVDDCLYGILKNNTSQVTAEIANMRVYCRTDAGSVEAPSRGIFETGGSGQLLLNIGSLSVQGAGGEAVHTDIASSVISVANLNVDSYNHRNNNYYALSGVSGSTINIGNKRVNTSQGSGEFNPTGCNYNWTGPRAITVANPGIESYYAKVDGAPRIHKRYFGRKAVTITATGFTNWSDVFPDGGTLSKVLSARASLGSLVVGTLAVDIYDGVAWSSIGAKVSASGTIYSTATGTVYVDYEVFGYV